MDEPVAQKTHPRLQNRRLRVFASGIKRPARVIAPAYFESGAYEKDLQTLENYLVDLWLFHRN